MISELALPVQVSKKADLKSIGLTTLQSPTTCTDRDLNFRGFERLNVNRPHITGSSEGIISGFDDLVVRRVISAPTWPTRATIETITHGCKKNVVSSRATCRDVELVPKTIVRQKDQASVMV